jgi:molybdenum cofactor cytidylyltransferase
MISAIILAAGQSTRMGRPKMPLPWGQSTVLGHVIDVFHAAEIGDVLVVTGANRSAAEQIAEAGGARTAYNAEYATEEMLGSLQAGLRAMGPEVQAILMALGDQPQILENTVRLIVDVYAKRSLALALIVPSYQMRRGHPWLVGRPLWDGILAMRSPKTSRDFLQEHAQVITYVDVDTPTILQDVDTPEDYLKSRG